MRLLTVGCLAFLLATSILGTACKPKTALPRTEPSTWSKGGWQEFMWGMGPGDVEEVLRSAKGELAPLHITALPQFEPASAPRADERWVSLPERLTLVGVPCEVRLGFYRGQLFRIAFIGTFPGSNEQMAGAISSWRDKLTSALTEKYGKSVRDEDFPGWPVIAWRAGPTTIALDDVNISDKTGNATRGLRYEDPMRSKLSDGLDPAEKNKL